VISINAQHAQKFVRTAKRFVLRGNFIVSVGQIIFCIFVPKKAYIFTIIFLVRSENG
jgi:uncharacterized membrane protein YdbT with pleckstrin-like domain